MVCILLVEDNPVFRDTIKNTLFSKYPELEVREAADGEEAMEKVGSPHPELIFMDIKLPGENGLILTERIKHSYPQIPIAILTEYDLPEYREAAFERGANYFLTKSATKASDLLDLVERLCFSQSKS